MTAAAEGQGHDPLRGCPGAPWLRSPAWDGFWMLSGLWLLLPIALLAGRPQPLTLALLGATGLFWISHRIATLHTAFCVPAYRGLVREQRARFVLLPAAICLAVLAFVYAPAKVVPLDNWGRIQVLGSIFFLYNTYHFGVQHYGVLSIYRIRAGQAPSGWLKGYERVLCLVVGGGLVACAQIGHGAQVVHDSLIYQWVSREEISAATGSLRVAAAVLVVLMSVIYYAGELRMPAPSSPKTLYVAGLALQGVLAYFLSPVAFLFLWGIQHWLVSVGLAAHMAQNDSSPIPAQSRWYAFWERSNRNFWPTVLGLCLVSVVLSPLFDYSVHGDTMTDGQFVARLVAPVLSLEPLAQLFVALSFASVYVHFVMDRAIFRFSDPAVRKVSGPLLFSRRG